MKKKLIMAVLLSSLLSLSIGIVIGIGINQKNLFGTGADGVGVTSVTSSGDGRFMVNGQSMDLGTLIMTLNLDRIQLLDQSLADQMAQIRSNNEKLKEANDIIAKMRASNVVTEEIFNYFLKNGFNLSGDSPNPAKVGDSISKDNWQGNIATVKSYIGSLNSQNQLDMTRMQSLVNKRNQTFENATNMLQKDQKTRDSIVGNMR